MEATLHNLANCSVLRVSGDMRVWKNEKDEQDLFKLFPAEMSFPGNRLVLSLAGLTNIDSLGITLLVKIVILCTRKNVAICTVLPGRTAGQSIRSTRIFAAWPEFKTEDAAVNQVAEGAAS